MLRGSYFPGFNDGNVDADLGDSAIMETMGLGGQIQAAAPVFQKLVGGTLQDAINHTREMMEISFGRNPAFVLPVLDSEAGPIGIDMEKVLEIGITPLINSAMAAKKGGFAGAGQVRVPIVFSEGVSGVRRKVRTLMWVTSLVTDQGVEEGGACGYR